MATIQNYTRSVTADTLWRQLNLTRELALTQFKLKYTGSVLGYLWSLVKPLMIFAIMYAVFSRLVPDSASMPHFAFQLLLGIVIWNFFAETVTNSVSVIASNGGLIKKAFFPRPILVIASSLASSITFLINLVLIVVVALPFHQAEVGWQTLAVVPLILELYILIIGLSMLLSSLFVFYRDLGHIWEVGSLVLFYGSAVVFPLGSVVLSAHLRSFLALNPIAQIIEDARHALISPKAEWSVTIIHSWAILIPFTIVIAVFVVGYATFRRLTPRFAEYL